VLDSTAVTWRYAGDARFLPFTGAAFLLQAAHPTIAAGVADHSNFQADPFGRLQHSYGLVLETMYSADGARIGAEVRRAHRGIKGVKPDGSRYSAYEPEASWWVLATGYQVIADAAARFFTPMTATERRRAYDEMREVGRRFGLRDRDMAATLPEFDDWYAWMLAERIEDSQTVRDVLATIRRPNPPGGVPHALWPLPREVAGRLAWLATIGLLPPVARARLDVSWSRIDEAQLDAIGLLYRGLEVVPASWWRLPPARAGYARDAATEAPAVTLAA
jgi:uncharacterized protein (DUF2236 family)